MVCVATSTASVPEIVNWVAPAGVVNDEVKVNVELPPAVTLVGLKLPVMPFGSPEADNAMVRVLPNRTAVRMVYVVLVPAVMVCEVGVEVMLKSLLFTVSVTLDVLTTPRVSVAVAMME
jgi:hypothetical protein